MLGHFGSMLPSNARIDATSKNGHTTTHPPKEKGGGWKKKGSQMAPIWSTKVSMERHMTAKLRHCPKMKILKNTMCFSLFLKPWAPIYEPCWVILGSCCRPMHALIHHRKMVTQQRGGANFLKGNADPRAPYTNPYNHLDLTN
jgi:hypothetical protein